MRFCISIQNCLFWCGRYSLIILAVHSIDKELHLVTLPYHLWPLEVLLRCTLTVVVAWLLVKIDVIKKIFCV